MVSLLTKRTGDRFSYNDDVNPKNDWSRYICTLKETEIFLNGNAQRKFQKLEGEMSDLLENIQGNKSFPTFRFCPNEVCVLGTKCCLQFYHDPKGPACLFDTVKKATRLIGTRQVWATFG